MVRCRQADQQLVESVIPAVCSRKSSMNTACFVPSFSSVTFINSNLLYHFIVQSVSEYKAKVNKDCQVKLDTENPLPADW